MLFLIAFADLAAADFADAGDFHQPLGLLAQYIQRLVAKGLHNLAGGAGAQALDEPAAQKPLDAAQGGRRLYLAAGRAELTAILRVLYPIAAE